MNVTVIPFFLAANVVVNDTSRWNFGPQYVYHLNYNTTNLNVSEKTSEQHTIPNAVQLSSTMKCCPKVSNRLLCQLWNFTYAESFTNYKSFKWITKNALFEIKYNKHGVESILINSIYASEENLNLIKRIADQMNLGVSLKYSNDDARFKDVENTSMGNCMTRYEIKREKSEAKLVNENTDFQLFMLPAIADTVPGTTISIEKRRQRCVNVPRRMHLYRRLSYQVLKMERFFSRMQIDDGFESFSKMEGKLRTYLPSNKTYFLPFKDIVRLKLISIEPYHNDFPTIDASKVYKLNVNTVPNQEMYELYD